MVTTATTSSVPGRGPHPRCIAIVEPRLRGSTPGDRTGGPAAGGVDERAEDARVHAAVAIRERRTGLVLNPAPIHYHPQGQPPGRNDRGPWLLAR
jgi:hypothetical protein